MPIIKKENKSLTKKEGQSIQRANLFDIIKGLNDQRYSLQMKQGDNREYEEASNSLIRRLVSQNPYVEFKNEPSIAIGRLKKNEKGEYFSLVKMIFISQSLVYDCFINDGKGLGDLFMVIGHEYWHYMQDVESEKLTTKTYAKKDLEEQKELSSFIRNKKVQSLSKETVSALLYIFSHILGKDFEGYKSLSTEEQQEICEKFLEARDINTRHEGAAQEKGYEFAEYMLNCLISDPMCDARCRKFLEQEKVDLLEKKKIDSYLNGIEGEQKKFEEVLGKLDPQDVFRIFAEARNGVKIVAVDEKSDKLKTFLNKTYFEGLVYIVDVVLKDSSKEEMEQVIYYCLENGFDEEFEQVLRLYREKFEISEKDKSLLSYNICDILKYGQLSKSDYLISFNDPEKDDLFLDESAVEDVLLSLLDQKKYISFVYMQMLNESNFKLNKVKKAFVLALEEMLSKVENGESVSRLELDYLASITVLGHKLDGQNSTCEKIKKLQDKLLQNSRNYNFLSREEEDKYILEKYGERMLVSVREKSGFDLRLEYERQEEIKKQVKNTPLLTGKEEKE